MKLIDLHIHSTASDGSLTPTEVVNRANDLGLTAMALTDHDTVAGIDEALEAAKDLDMEVIPGIEVSCIYKGKEIHILGLYIDHKDPKLLSFLKEASRKRYDRNMEMLAHLMRMDLRSLRKISSAEIPEPSSPVHILRERS